MSAQTSNSKLIAIGDIHGHYLELKALFKKMKKEWGFVPHRDTVVFLGDFVDGGPRTKQVLDQLMEWQKEYPHWHFLYGNHEDLLLDAFNPRHPVYGDYYLWWNQGGKETLDSFKLRMRSEYKKAIVQPEDLLTETYRNWIANLETYFETEKYFFVHAGISPDLTIQEIKDGLNGKYVKDLKYEMIWFRDGFYNSENDWGKKIIFGHTTWPTFEPRIWKNKIGIDTMMHNRGRLTALLLPEETFIQVNSQSEDL